MRGHTITHYTLTSAKLKEDLTLALVTDLHNGPYDDVLDVLRQTDAILMCGDLVNRHKEEHEQAAAFLRDAPRCAPTFFAIGNHELKYVHGEAFLHQVQKSDVMLLDNAWTAFRGLVIGGMSSDGGQRSPDAAVLSEMEKQPGFRLLMCHHPEYFVPFVRAHAIDLTVSGHAHGGQVALFGQGLLAPGQGLLPKWTHGFYENNRLLVSRGMTNSAGVPRIGVPCELVILHLNKERS